MDMRRAVIVFPLVAILSLLMVASLRILFADLAFRSAEVEVSFWGRGKYQPEAASVAGAGVSVERALSLWPQQPDYLRLQSRLLMWQAYWSDSRAGARRLETLALETLFRAARSRPAHRATWLELELELKRLDRQGPELREVQLQLERLGSG